MRDRPSNKRKGKREDLRSSPILFANTATPRALDWELGSTLKQFPANALDQRSEFPRLRARFGAKLNQRAAAAARRRGLREYGASHASVCEENRTQLSSDKDICRGVHPKIPSGALLDMQRHPAQGIAWIVADALMWADLKSNVVGATPSPPPRSEATGGFREVPAPR